jgi:hypothetical protein
MSLEKAVVLIERKERTILVTRAGLELVGTDREHRMAK